MPLPWATAALSGRLGPWRLCCPLDAGAQSIIMSLFMILLSFWGSGVSLVPFSLFLLYHPPWNSGLPLPRTHLVQPLTPQTFHSELALFWEDKMLCLPGKGTEAECGCSPASPWPQWFPCRLPPLCGPSGGAVWAGEWADRAVQPSKVMQGAAGRAQGWCCWAGGCPGPVATESPYIIHKCHALALFVQFALEAGMG